MCIHSVPEHCTSISASTIRTCTIASYISLTMSHYGAVSTYMYVLKNTPYPLLFGYRSNIAEGFSGRGGEKVHVHKKDIVHKVDV